jgi:uncharacterized Zn finger protein (UPF0148 family)
MAISNEVPTPCPDCGGNCYDYNGIQVCEDCYHRVIEEMEREELAKDELRRLEKEADDLRWAEENK